MSNGNILKSVEQYVFDTLKSGTPSEFVYHDINHTTEVVEACEKIGKKSGLSDDDIEILLIAAWFHDVGYLETSEQHEEQSAKAARKFLEENNYPEKKINRITSAIMSTKLPTSPKDLLEEVLCDADLLHVGKEEFFDKSDLFRAELERRNKKPMDDIFWLNKNIDFVTSHKFYTQFAREQFEEQKNTNLLKLQKKYRKKLAKFKEEDLKSEKLELEKEKFAAKKELDKKAERGIETMFRNVMRTHVSFSAMADNKANIMISVNTLILTAIIAVLARKLDSNPHLIFPTALLTFISLTTLIFAVLVTRPKVTQGTFTKEDIKNKSTNLLFFGNFSNMNLEDFSWGMQEMMDDKDYLYSSMIKDFYYLGIVLGQKYKYLRLCYNIFMYGLILSVIAFTAAVILYPHGTNLGPLLE